MTEDRISELKCDAISARARGDQNAERIALGALALIDIASTCEGMATNGEDGQ
jgi:hypothetical protein